MNKNKSIFFIKLGALTNKPYAFQNRPWDLEYIVSIDPYDSLGTNIRVDLYGSEIKRILPLKNDLINEDWISNRTRFFFEGFFKWRVNIPFIKKKKKLIQASWLDCFFFFFINLWFYSVYFKEKYIGFLLDVALDIELLIILKLFSIVLGFIILTTNSINIGEYYLYYLNPNFYKDINENKIFLFLGINLRLESPILNIKFRKKKIKDNIIFVHIGSLFNDNLNSLNLSLSTLNLIKLLKGKLKFNIYLLKKIKKNNKNFLDLTNDKISCIIGHSLYIQKNNKNIFNLLLNNTQNIKLLSLFNSKFNYYTNYLEIYYNNFLIKNLVIEYYKSLYKNVNIIFLNLFNLIYHEIFFEKKNKIVKWWNLNIFYLLNQKKIINQNKNKFFIFQGHHIDLNLLNVNIILPNKIILEKENFFIDITGSFLKTNKISTMSGKSKNDWMILNALYLYSLTFFNKIYNFNKYNKNINKMQFNHYFWYIDNKKILYKYIKKYTISYYFKQITNKLYNIINVNNISINNNQKIIIIYNKIIDNYYYNNYQIYITDKYSRTLLLSSENFNFYIKNYINI